jgi:hypothetical protein
VGVVVGGGVDVHGESFINVEKNKKIFRKKFKPFKFNRQVINAIVFGGYYLDDRMMINNDRKNMKW